MHLDELYRGIGLILAIAVIGAIVWGVAQIVPQVQAVGTLPARIEAENSRVQAQAKLDAAQLEAQAKTAPTRAALDVQAKQAEIENARTQAQAHAQAELIQAQALAEATRAQTQAQAQTVLVIGGAFLLAVLLIVSGIVILNGLSARNAQRNLQTVLEIAAREGGRVELPNGQAVVFALPGERQALLAAHVGPAAPAAESAGELHPQAEAVPGGLQIREHRDPSAEAGIGKAA